MAPTTPTISPKGSGICGSFPSRVHTSEVVSVLHPACMRRCASPLIHLIPRDSRTSVRVAIISDKNLLDQAHFVLAVNAEVPVKTLRRNFPAQVKIGPVEKISILVDRALPGIALEPLATAPRQIRYHAGATYFALNDKEPLWKELSHSGGIALHVSGQFPGLELDLWAIKR